MTNNYKATKKYLWFKEEYPEYFQILKLIGDYYFLDLNTPNNVAKDSLNVNSIKNIILSIDEEELDLILNPVLNGQSGLSYLVEHCLNLLQISEYSTGNIFEELQKLVDRWKVESIQEYPPQLCFVILFILAVTKMGEESDSEDDEQIDDRNYYKQLLRILNSNELFLKLNFTNSSLQTYFRTTFGNQNDENSPSLFNVLSEWIDINFPNLNNTFKPNLSDTVISHLSWVKNQAIYNKKDILQLTEFFIKEGFKHNQTYSKEQFFRALKIYLTHPLKRISFSKGFINIVIDEKNQDYQIYKEKIRDLTFDTFNSWDGKARDRDGSTNYQIKNILSETTDGFQVQLYFENLDDKNNNLIEDLENEFSLVESASNENIIFKNNPFSLEKYTTLSNGILNLDGKRNKFTFKDSDKKITFYQNNEKIQIYRYDEYVLKKWIQLGNSEFPVRSETYVVLCNNNLLDQLKKWIYENPNFGNNFKIIQNESFAILENLTLIDSQFVKSTIPEFDIFSPENLLSTKIELIDGLKLSGRRDFVYMERELPTIYIPEDLYENFQYELYINDVKFDVNNSFIYPEEYVELDIDKTYTITDNLDDEFKIEFKFLKDESFNHHKSGSLGYQFTTEIEKFIWEDSKVRALDYEEQINYVTGAKVYLSNENTLFKDSTPIFEFSKSTKKLFLIGRNIDNFSEVEITNNSFNWLETISEEVNRYYIKKLKDDENGYVFELNNALPFAQSINNFLKEHPFENLTWIIVLDNFQNIKVYQAGSKEPKKPNTNLPTNTTWVELFVQLNQIFKDKKNNFKIELVDENSSELFSNYIKFALDVSNDINPRKDFFTEKDTEILRSENYTQAIMTEEEREFRNATVEFPSNNFLQLPGERLLRYMTNIGSGTIDDIKKRIEVIAKSYQKINANLSNLLLSDEYLKYRILDNYSFLMHLEWSGDLQKWSVCKPSINILPGIKNRAIITGSRNDSLIKKILEVQEKKNSFMVEFLDNSGLLGKLTKQNLDISNNYKHFSPLTILISEFDNLQELKIIAKEIDIEETEVNSFTAYELVKYLDDIESMIQSFPIKNPLFDSIKERFTFFEVTKHFDSQKTILLDKYSNAPETIKNNDLIRVKSLNRYQYFIKKDENYFNISREVALWHQIHLQELNLVFKLRTQLPSCSIVFPSYLRLPELYLKILGLCLGINPRKILKFNGEFDTPKFDVYHNIPESVANELFINKLKVPIIEIESLSEIPQYFK